MATSSLDRELRERVEAFINELTGLVRQSALASVQEALGGEAAPARRGPGRPRKNAAAKPSATGKKRGRPGRMSPAEVQQGAERVLAYVKANAGQRLDQIAKALKTTTANLKRPVALLLESKSVRREGQRRGTTYHLRGGAGVGGGGAKTRKKAHASKKGSRKGRRKAGKKSARK